MKKKHLSNKKAKNIIENSQLKKKRHRKADVKWTLEEEYLFFEIHKFFGNKWKKFSPYFPYKTTKELKNHFHTCIIKTVRRAINYNLNYEFIDILRCFYSIDQIILILNEMNFNNIEKDLKINSNNKKIQNEDNINKNCILKKKKRDNKYNPKILSKKGKLTNGILINYKNYLFNEILMKRKDIQNFLNTFFQNQKFNIENLNWLFDLIIKSKIINKCKNFLLKSYYKLNINIINNLFNYICQNSSLIYLDELFFNTC
jgi:hypothetical protein